MNKEITALQNIYESLKESGLVRYDPTWEFPEESSEGEEVDSELYPGLRVRTIPSEALLIERTEPSSELFIIAVPHSRESTRVIWTGDDIHTMKLTLEGLCLPKSSNFGETVFKVFNGHFEELYETTPQGVVSFTQKVVSGKEKQFLLICRKLVHIWGGGKIDSEFYETMVRVPSKESSKKFKRTIYPSRKRVERAHLRNWGWAPPYPILGVESERFLEHVKLSLEGELDAPSLMVPSDQHGRLYITLSEALLRKCVDDPARMKKPLECALKYGFRGYSKGGRNGIFYLRKQDTGLHRAVEDYLSQASIQQEAERALLLDDYQGLLPDLPPVKIVYHQPSGERVVGILNEDTQRIIFLGFASY